MSRWAYVNGHYRRHADAWVLIDDRGYQFGDGVYEVWAVRRGRLLDMPRHLARLQRSLGELNIRAPMSPRALRVVLEEVRRRNRVRDGLVYLQVTRGVARRDHAFPNPAPAPSMVATSRAIDLAEFDARTKTGVKVVTRPDQRWGRCDIKSTALIANVLAKQAARDAGALEAWLVDADGFITEGASTTAWIVDAQGRLITRSIQDNILPGVTRAAIVELAKAQNIELLERAFTPREAAEAREAFMTAAGALVMPVIEIDGHQIGDGAPGPVARSLGQAYLTFAQGQDQL